jgi:hypothetical protein
MLNPIAALARAVALDDMGVEYRQGSARFKGST